MSLSKYCHHLTWNGALPRSNRSLYQVIVVAQSLPLWWSSVCNNLTYTRPSVCDETDFILFSALNVYVPAAE